MAAKEFWGLVRQPQLLLLLLVGPVLVMVAFGLSLDVRDVLRPRAVVVVEPGSEGARLFERFRHEFTSRTNFVGTTDDPETARQRLLRGEVDAVISIPPDPLETVSRGEQANLGVTYNTINPVFGTRVPRRAYGLVLDLNQSLVEAGIERRIGNVRSAQERIRELNRRFEKADRAAEALASGEARSATAEMDETLTALENSLRLLRAVGAGEERDTSTALERIEAARRTLEEVREAQKAGPEAIEERSGLADLEENLASLREALAGLPADLPPRVLANPFEGKFRNLASPPGVVGFYAPGVLALLVQHIAVSLASLSVIRERLGGAYEFFEVSPLGAGELLAGKFATYFGLVLGANLAVAVVLARFLGVPVEGTGSTVLAMALLAVASLGVGFLVSALAKSQLQAVQVSMLLLIASALFSGFLFPSGAMDQPARGLSYLLPATYGIRALQDAMVRGEGVSGPDLAGLLVIAAVCLGLARYLMRQKKA